MIACAKLDITTDEEATAAYKRAMRKFSPDLVDFQNQIGQYDTSWGLRHLLDGPTEEEKPRLVKQFAPVWVKREGGELVWYHGFGSSLQEPDPATIRG